MGRATTDQSGKPLCPAPHVPGGSNPDFLLEAARALPPSATLVPEGSSLVNLRNSCLSRRVASRVTATTDFFVPDILNKCGRAVPH
jgi:hypothetical protein